MSKFSTLLEETLNNEMKLHISFCNQLGIEESTLKKIIPTTATSAYTNFLVKTGYECGFPEIISALLPCMATYAEIGIKLDSIKQTNINPAYEEWIKMYSSQEFQDLSKWITELVDKEAENCTENEKNKMKKVYIASCKFELDFWTSSLYKVRWNKG